MADRYDSVDVTNYNANPPSDDGSATEANRVYWSTIKTKLTDMLVTAITAINTNLIAAFGKIEGGVTTTAVDYTVQASDQGKLVKVTVASKTITTPDAATVGSPFVFDFLNASSGTATLDGNGSQTIDGAASVTVPAGYGVRIRTDGTNWFTNGQNFPTVVIYPPKAQFSNLAIKVTGNTGLTVTADAITVTDGTTALMLTSVSHTINMATTGANALDAGSIASATWYAIWEIAKADGTKAALASTSFTSPTLPTDYIHKARIGAVRTASGSAQLMGTWQLGRRVQYKVGLAQTSTAVLATSGASGSTTTPTWTAVAVGAFVPSTASAISVSLVNNGGGAIMTAPNNSYGAFNSTTNAPPLVNNTSGGFSSMTLSMLLESTSIYWASAAAGSYLYISGWEDNI